jgi:hypothetical protein
MAEDSGAFKTNPANSGWIPAFFGDRLVIGEQRCSEASRLRKRFPARGRGYIPPIFNKRQQAVAVF